MDGTDALSISVIGELANIERNVWDALANPADAPFDPFLAWDFLQALEESGSASAASGWQPAHLIAREAGGAIVGAMPLYAKDHSYGEYVFDHAWADAMHRAGGNYYPKLQCAVPFTPVPGRRIFAADQAVEAALAQGAIGLAQRAARLSHPRRPPISLVQSRLFQLRRFPCGPLLAEAQDHPSRARTRQRKRAHQAPPGR
jgi:predicted N-acyltransferase